jgi:hypothetical protein
MAEDKQHPGVANPERFKGRWDKRVKEALKEDPTYNVLAEEVAEGVAEELINYVSKQLFPKE